MEIIGIDKLKESVLYLHSEFLPVNIESNIHSSSYIISYNAGTRYGDGRQVLHKSANLQLLLQKDGRLLIRYYTKHNSKELFFSSGKYDITSYESFIESVQDLLDKYFIGIGKRKPLPSGGGSSNSP